MELLVDNNLVKAVCRRARMKEGNEILAIIISSAKPHALRAARKS
jgi:hypothetical protein